MEAEPVFLLAVLAFVGVLLALPPAVIRAMGRWREGVKWPLMLAVSCESAQTLLFGAALCGRVQYHYVGLSGALFGIILIDISLGNIGGPGRRTKTDGPQAG
jgi:hypothetical protein